MKNLLIFGIILISNISCTSQPTVIKEETNFESKSSDLASILKTYQSLSEEIKHVYKKDTTRLELYLQISENAPIKRVSHFSDTLGTYFDCYNLIRNKSEQIIYILESPASESGDWELFYENYFDTNGNLVAFIRKCRFFNGECAETVIEESDYYYNSKHDLIKKAYMIVDDNEKPLDYTKCVIDYRFDYKKYTTLTEYLKKHRFEK